MEIQLERQNRSWNWNWTEVLSTTSSVILNECHLSGLSTIGGLDRWTGLVDWTGELIAKRSGSHSVVSRSPARVCDIYET